MRRRGRATAPPHENGPPSLRALSCARPACTASEGLLMSLRKALRAQIRENLRCRRRFGRDPIAASVLTAEFSIANAGKKGNFQTATSKKTIICSGRRSSAELMDRGIMQIPKSSGSRIPVFVISFNRGEYLNRVIRSYLVQDTAVEVVIHDNGSDDPTTLNILSDLALSGIKVYRYGAIRSPDELNNVDLSVRRYEDETGYNGPYVVTDCDVDLSTARPDALRTYIALLNMFGDAECVGPMLTIVDVPRCYPLFNRVMQRHVEQFWGREPEWAQLPNGRIAYLTCPIDTTFAVHRAGSAFRRLKQGLRVYHPYEAKHLDWYLSKEEATSYRVTSSPEISHWDNQQELSKFAQLLDTTLTYTIVEGQIGDLRAVVKSTLDNPSTIPGTRAHRAVVLPKSSRWRRLLQFLSSATRESVSQPPL